jgi:ribosomal protein L28
MCRLVSRDDDTVIAVSVSAEALRAFQLASLANPNAKLSGFKPIPPGFVFDKP